MAATTEELRPKLSPARQQNEAGANISIFFISNPLDVVEQAPIPCLPKVPPGN